MEISGVWLPIVTPFVDGEVDYRSYENLVRHYKGKGIRGIMPLGTTGESPSVSESEAEKIMEATMDVVDGELPVFMGLGGNNTESTVRRLKLAEKYKVDGILSVCPYYNRPSADGLYEHFKRISEATPLKIIIYNIPYRTGVNMDNGTLIRLAELENMVGVKDSCGNIQQTLELIRRKPDGFSVLTGEDLQFYLTVACGGDGGILASSHLNTEAYVDVFKLLKGNDHQGALARWRHIEPYVSLLFREPNPAPLKYCLGKMNLIGSSELRLPLTGISETLQQELDRWIE